MAVPGWQKLPIYNRHNLWFMLLTEMKATNTAEQCVHATGYDLHCLLIGDVT